MKLLDFNEDFLLSLSNKWINSSTHDTFDITNLVISCLPDFAYFLRHSVKAIKILVLTDPLKWIIGFFPNEDHISYPFLSEDRTCLARLSQYLITVSGILDM